MIPKVFQILNANPNVKALLGSNPLRVYPWNRAPKDVRLPYAVYGVYNGTPENYLDRVPDVDNIGTQIEIFCSRSDNATACFSAVRDALEPFAHMTSFAVPDLDTDTDLYISRLEFDFWNER